MQYIKNENNCYESPSSVSAGLQGFHLHGFYFNLSFEIKLNLFSFFEMPGSICGDSVWQF